MANEHDDSDLIGEHEAIQIMGRSVNGNKHVNIHEVVRMQAIYRALTAKAKLVRRG